ncbi:proton channel OTOP1-like [Rhinatrema bivittatum]|uniref:proton channel OTOP1-like n=1 Tax=Rhinatrema bivittatum TaxID=194408 RepID=UPI0011293FF2|nr:proton channel OTOP1-like [Rhinatrema bivittatum]
MAEDNTLDALPQERISLNLKLSPSPSTVDNKLLKKSVHFKLTKSYPEKNAELLSRQYGINVFLAGLLLMFVSSLDISGIPKPSLLSYLVTLMLIQFIWMIWYIYISYRQRKLSKEKDTHAGTRWLKCAILLFAGITLILDAMKVGYFIGYLECESITEVIYPVTHIMHTLLQVYFLWFHAKDIIQSFKTLERFGLIHSVFTNLLLWAAAVLTESKHQLFEHKERLSTLGFENITLQDSSPTCNCSMNACSILSKGIYYLYPFNLEYHILASTMLYVLWKNIGSKEKHHAQKKSFHFQGILTGTVLGLSVLAVTVAVVIVYFIQIGSSKSKSESVLIMYYLYGITILTLMCAAEFVGLFLYRKESKFQEDEAKSPAIKLDTSLLVGSACGSWLMSLGSILAIVGANAHPVYTWYNLPYSILIIIEKSIQNLFVTEFVYLKEEAVKGDGRTVDEIFTISSESTLSLVSPYDDMCHKPDSNEELPAVANGNECNDDKCDQGYDPVGLPAATVPSHATSSRRMSLKRIVLKNIAAFLFLCNISLWIPPAFGCRPQYDNGLEEIVFGFIPWIILIDIAMPFSVFYRMHSAFSIFEIYCKF